MIIFFTLLWNAFYTELNSFWCSAGRLLRSSSYFLNAWPGVRKDMRSGPRWGPATEPSLAKAAGSGWRVEASTCCMHTHIQTQETNWCHILCQYTTFFFLSTPTKRSSLFNIMKPQWEPAGLCSSIWRLHRWLPGHTLDPSNWLWQQREMDKWEAPPEWPEDWGRNEETCSVSRENPVGKVKFECLIFCF